MFHIQFGAQIYQRDDYMDMMAYNKKGEPKKASGKERLRNIVLDKTRISKTSEFEQKMVGSHPRVRKENVIVQSL